MKLLFLLLGYVIMISQYRHMCIDYRIKHRIFIIYKSLHWELMASSAIISLLIYITILFIINSYLTTYLIISYKSYSLI